MSDRIMEWLDESQRLADKATEGPWEFYPWSRDTVSGDFVESFLMASASLDEEMTRCLPDSDGEFIAEARTRLPQAVEALREVANICGEHFDGQMRRAEKLGRSVPDCSCEVCRVMQAVEAALGLKGDGDVG